MFKIVLFVPVASKEEVKRAMFVAGAGVQGAYENCSFEVIGTGQFRPLQGASPAIGSVGELERVEEARVEMLCPAECLGRVIRALKAAHPYEEPAYDIIQTIDSEEYT